MSTTIITTKATLYDHAGRLTDRGVTVSHTHPTGLLVETIQIDTTPHRRDDLSITRNHDLDIIVEGPGGWYVVIPHHESSSLHLLNDPAAVALGRKGGSANTEAQNAARRANGRKGGRPRKEKPANQDE